MRKNWNPGEQLWHWHFIHGYPLMIFLGVLAAFLTTAYFWKRYKYSWDILQVLVIVVIPSSIFGARFYTLVFDGGWDQWYQLAGLSIYGGLIFAIGSGLIYLWFVRHSVDIRTVLTIGMPAILIGQAIGRWGNFFNHEIYGKVVSGESLNWITFLKSNMYIDGEYRAPLFLYEFLASLAGYLIIVWWLNRKAYFKPGATAALYILWYAIERLVLQTQRDSSPQNTSYIGNTDIPLNLVVSILLIFLGIGLFIWFEGFSKPFDKWFIKISKWFGLYNWADKHVKKEYKLIAPIKPRKIFFFGPRVEYVREFYMYFGEKKPNIVKLWLPVRERRWTKREINQGHKNN